MRPPESAPDRARDIVGRVGLGVMEPMGGGPGERIARAVGHREEDQHRAYPWIQLERAMGDRPMVCDGGSDAADPGEPDSPQQHPPSRQRIEARPASAVTWISPIQRNTGRSCSEVRHHGHSQGRIWPRRRLSRVEPRGSCRASVEDSCAAAELSITCNLLFLPGSARDRCQNRCRDSTWSASEALSTVCLGLRPVKLGLCEQSDRIAPIAPLSPLR